MNSYLEFLLYNTNFIYESQFLCPNHLLQASLFDTTPVLVWIST